jgi:hypothetical protein
VIGNYRTNQNTDYLSCSALSFQYLVGQRVRVRKTLRLHQRCPPTNVTEELDVKIDATEPLPANGTIAVDISGADDIDIDVIPPEGVSIIVTNTTVTVTNHLVEISEGATEASSAASLPDTAGLDMGPSTASNNENDEEGSTGNDDDSGGGGGSS